MTRIFSADKVVGGKAMNVLGVQVARTVVARLAYNARGVRPPSGVAQEVAELRREGILVWPDFLPQDRFDNVRTDCARLDASGCAERFTHGPTTLDVIELRKVPLADLPSIRAFYGDQRLHAVFTAVEQRPLGALEEYGKREHVLHGEPQAGMDPQSELHSDIFFNTHKAWLYLHDVRVEHGPLAYVKRSHRLTPARLGFVYRDSWTRHAAEELSRRITPEEQEALHATETVVTCAANTLVIVNTAGYHRRLPGRPGATRDSFHLSVRTDPFAFHRWRARLSEFPRLKAFLRGITMAGRP